jgi:hypothetical protein
MGKGGLLDLVAHGVQDIYLIGNPNYSYFKKVYKRHTNFVQESIKCVANGTSNFGEKVTLTVPRNGDLLSTVFIEVDLPELTGSGEDSLHSISYVSNIGQALIEYVELKIGGQTIDKQYTEWMYIWNQLTLGSPKVREYNEMIKSTASNGPMTVYIPLQFWFCRDIANALPLVALQYHVVEIDVKFRPLEKLYNFGSIQYYDLEYVQPYLHNGVQLYQYQRTAGDLFTSDIDGKTLVYNNGGSTTPIVFIQGDNDKIYLSVQLTDGIERAYVQHNYTLVGAPEITDVRFYLDFIYLDTVERSYFAKEEHRYLIEQVQYSDPVGVATSELTKAINLTFNLPVKELFWVCQNDEVLAHNEILKFSNSLDTSYENNTDDIITAKLQYNGDDRFENRSGEYFRLIQPFKHHRQSVFDKYIYVYSLALKPEDHQPSGASNFSKIDTAKLEFTLRNTRPYTSTIKVYAMNYNILRIAKGMAGIAFAN